ncbi:MAG: hypothetical protein GXO32_06645 [Crenarchaeota archaeon]|nr:hypothetical protein [Thermoproteota archaeon]
MREHYLGRAVKEEELFQEMRVCREILYKWNPSTDDEKLEECLELALTT